MLHSSALTIEKAIMVNKVIRAWNFFDILEIKASLITIFIFSSSTTNIFLFFVFFGFTTLSYLKFTKLSQHTVLAWLNRRLN
jgi:hypothetical protein